MSSSHEQEPRPAAGGAPQQPSLRRDAPALVAFQDSGEECGRECACPAADIAENVLRAAHRLRCLLGAHFGSCGLSDVRFLALRVLRDCAPTGCTQAELAAHLDQSESSVSTLVDRMRDGNLIYRLRSKSDRRKRVLLLTEQGRQMLAQAESHYDEWATVLMARFDDRQLAELAGLLRQLVHELSRAAPGDSARHEPEPQSAPYYRQSAELPAADEPQRHRPVA